MSWTQTGANIATMLGSLSVITALTVWGKGRWRRWRNRKEETRLRNWHGSIDIGGIETWYVRLVEHPPEATARVVLEVLDADNGEPSVVGGHHMRQRIAADRRLSRSPTTGELEFLRYLRAERGYAKSPIVH